MHKLDGIIYAKKGFIIILVCFFIDNDIAYCLYYSHEVRLQIMARQHNSKETREMIIDSAVENFIAKGYSKTTLEDIVKHVGLTRGAFYWNFESKKELLDEIVNRYEQFYLDIYDSYQHNSSAYQTLKGFLLLNLRKKNTINPYATIIRYKVEDSEETATFKERQAKMDEHFLRIIENEIARGQAQGEFRTDKAPDILAMTLYIYLLGYDTYSTVHNSDTNGHVMPDDVIEEHVDYLLSTLT